jgi:hypothetical protein
MTRDLVQPSVGDHVMVARIGEPEFALQVKRVNGLKGDVGAQPDAHLVELSDGSEWWIILRRMTHDEIGRRVTWVGSKRITPNVR